MAQEIFPGGRGRRNLLGGTHQATRRLGSGIRIYKNANDEVLALDCFEITANVQQLLDGPITFHRSVDSINVSRTLIHLNTGSRVVVLIQMIGNYSSITTDGGNFLVAQWDAATPDENDVVISFENQVSKLGETV